MSKKSLKNEKKAVNSVNDINYLKLLKIDEKSVLEFIVGSTNVKRWNLLKTSFSCETNETFTTKLLDLAEEYLKRNKCNENDDNDCPPKVNKDPIKSKKKKTDEIEEKQDTSTVLNETTLKPLEQSNINNATPEKTPKNSTSLKNGQSKPAKIEKENKVKKKKPVNEKPVKREKNDIRKAPELDSQLDKLDNKIEEDNNNTNVADIKIKLCQNCGTRHIQDHCPLNYPNYIVSDAVTHDEWLDKFRDVLINENDEEEREKLSFSRVSLPDLLNFGETNTECHGLGVFTTGDIEEFTQFGPLIGKIVKEVDISEDSTMRDLWEICQEGGNIYFNTENAEISNWMRFVRPAPSREDKNITVITKQNCLYFVSTKFIRNGEELLYWQDSIAASSKKKMEKTSCGGCNMTFTHPLYYRTHCSVFHDIRYSLTIRKYHCKICGAAVLGKENIMKHAADLHNGQGAYQCQFCKKFFLRLNYLEMHRTYGCSANPHRSRPLCDFCGRKFCQPQKLKVHIKRMHSDFSEVLKEFQCKSCMKILGSRAALQRHLKEVHQKQMDGACSCIKCGKHFQNKSNLKIHMLTHSGIKPFKCIVKSCNAAFTTKQCLQFHYKKVHNFNEEVMPKIERSIDYTFEAYSGLEENEEKEREDMNRNDEDDDDSDDSIDSKTIDDPPALQSPLEMNTTSPEPQINENYTTMKILSKGSKKWIADQPNLIQYQMDSLPVPKSNLNDFGRNHEASNASLLVEAALDSVCSEPNIDIDVSTTPQCPDPLNNLYLPPTLPEYNETVCITNENRDILMSPPVNDNISVTDDLNQDQQNQNLTMDYSGFPQETDFSPATSPDLTHRNNYVRNYINNQNYGQKSPPNGVPSPPRYDFGHAVNTADHLSSDDSNGMAAQNLSLHSKHELQLDLSIYKSPYKIDLPNFHSRRLKMSYEDEQLNEEQEEIQNIQEIKEKTDDNRKYPDDLSTEIRNKFDIDLDLRLKSYNDDNELRSRLYESSDLDFRNKSYDLIDKSYDNTMEQNDFRTDRNFEPLVLNSELQGLDMSARSFHNYPNINRYHHLYPEVDRVDLRLNYSPPPPPPPSYTHADILRVVSLDLTPPGRHSVDLSLRPHPALHQIHGIQPNHRLLDPRHLAAEPARLLGDSGRILSDHTTNRILGNNDQLTNHLLSDDSRIIPDQTRLLEQSRLIGGSNGTVSPPTPPTFSGYSQSPYHPTALVAPPPRPHVSASPPTPASYHHYSGYY